LVTASALSPLVARRRRRGRLVPFIVAGDIRSESLADLVSMWPNPTSKRKRPAKAVEDSSTPGKKKPPSAKR